MNDELNIEALAEAIQAEIEWQMREWDQERQQDMRGERYGQTDLPPKADAG